MVTQSILCTYKEKKSFLNKNFMFMNALDLSEAFYKSNKRDSSRLAHLFLNHYLM